MTNLMQRFLRSQSCLRAIPRLTQKPCIVKSVSVESDPFPLANPVITVTRDESLRFYPSFPIGYGYSPAAVPRSGIIDTVPFTNTAVEEEKEEKEVVIYADSVKRKRKKKMNKHKYKKLRKTQGSKS